MLRYKKNILSYITQCSVKAVFHFNRIVAKRSVLYCVHIICLTVHETMKYATFRYDTAEVENSLKNDIGAQNMLI